MSVPEYRTLPDMHDTIWVHLPVEDSIWSASNLVSMDSDEYTIMTEEQESYALTQFLCPKLGYPVQAEDIVNIKKATRRRTELGTRAPPPDPTPLFQRMREASEAAHKAVKDKNNADLDKYLYELLYVLRVFAATYYGEHFLRRTRDRIRCLLMFFNELVSMIVDKADKNADVIWPRAVKNNQSVYVFGVADNTFVPTPIEPVNFGKLNKVLKALGISNTNADKDVIRKYGKYVLLWDMTMSGSTEDNETCVRMWIDHQKWKLDDA